MTTTFNNALIIALTAFLSIAAMIAVTATARANAPGMTVRITDSAAVEHSIGRCDSGYQLRDVGNSGSPLVPFRNGEATVTQRLGTSMVAPMFYCAGERLGFPHAGVELEMH